MYLSGDDAGIDNEANERMHEGLLELGAELESRYFTALESLGCTPREGYSSLRDYVDEAVPGALHIDRTGYSPEVASVLGGNYLNGTIIILSEEQCSGSSTIDALPRENTGLVDIVNAAGTAFRALILSVLPKEALILRSHYALVGDKGSYHLGEVLNNLANGKAPRYQLVGAGVCVHDLYVRASTPSKAAWNARACQKSLLALSEETIDDYLFGERREELDNCAVGLQSLGRLRYDKNDLYRMSSARFEAHARLKKPFRYTAFRESVDDIVFDIIPAREAFIIHASGELPFGKGCPWPVVSISDTGQLMDCLFEAGYLDLDYDTIDCALFDVGLETLEEAAFPTELIKDCGTNIVKLFHQLARDDVMVHLPDEWFILRDIYMSHRTGKMKNREELAGLYSGLSERSKIAVSVPSDEVIDDSILSWLMAEWVPQFLED